MFFNLSHYSIFFSRLACHDSLETLPYKRNSIYQWFWLIHRVIIYGGWNDNCYWLSLPLDSTSRSWISFGPGEAMVWQRYGSIWFSHGLVPEGTKPLPKPMLTYHWWGYVWHSPKTNFTGSAVDINSYNEFEKYTYKIISTLLRGQWVKAW